MKWHDTEIDDPDVRRAVHDQLGTNDSPILARQHRRRPDRVVPTLISSMRAWGRRSNVLGTNVILDPRVPLRVGTNGESGFGFAVDERSESASLAEFANVLGGFGEKELVDRMLEVWGGVSG